MFPIFWSALGMQGKKEVPVREMTKAILDLGRLPNNPRWDWATRSSDIVRFRGLGLAHAVVKADFLEKTDPHLPGIGFVLSTERFIDWSNSRFSLQDGAVERLSDFVKNSFVGRIGQGLTILFGQSKGYAFAAHLSTYLAELDVQTRDSSGRQLPVADFVCERTSSERAIFESKASTRSGKYSATQTKALLKKALRDQVNQWLGQVPRVTRGYATCSYLKETSATEESTIVFADPKGEDKADEERADSAVRRMNYASWLRAMGFQSPAMRLLYQRSEPEVHLFDVVRIGGIEVALPAACRTWTRPERGGEHILTAGISLAALKAVEAAINGRPTALLQLPSLVPKLGEPGAPYSMFPDGTYFGGYPWGHITGERIRVYI